jgi:hypothetical protein
VREIQGMGEGEIRSVLPLPPTENWKFAGALPENAFREMAFSDYYQVEEFREIFTEMTLSDLPCLMPVTQVDP